MNSYLNNLASLQATPGDSFKYVNTNFAILAQMLMISRGASTYDEMLATLFERASLNMPNTGTIPSNHPSIDHLAQGYLKNGRLQPNFALPTWPAFLGAGGIYSTIGDMLVWLQFNLNQLQSPYNGLLTMIQEIRFIIGTGRATSLGWFAKDVSGTTRFDKNGGTGGFHSYIGFWPGPKIGVVVLCNSALGSPVDALGHHILDELLPR